MAELIEAVPNFSEGRDQHVVRRIAGAADRRRAHVLDVHTDPQHNRSVVTIAGFATHVVNGLFGAIAAAVTDIDLARHEGLHPRVGVADVVPLVPLGETPMARCVELARELGRRVWRELRVPVFFYAEAAEPPRSRTLAAIRAGRFEPDLGEARDGRAGAVCIGARPTLVAYNVVLPNSTAEQGKALAARIRESSGGMRGVQALAFRLRSGMQLSMNLVDLSAATPAAVFAEVLRLAETMGVEVGDEEVVGLCPAAAASRAADGRVLEARLAASATAVAARDCGASGVEERRRVAAKLRAAARRIAATTAEPSAILAAAEESVAIRRVVTAAGCLEEDVALMLDHAARGLRAALPEPVEDVLQTRLAAFDRWIDSG